MPRTLQVGDSIILSQFDFDSLGIELAGRVPVWASSAPGVVSVDSATGEITCLTPGSAVITAQVEGQKGTFGVTVVAGAPVLSLTRSPTTLTLGVGQVSTINVHAWAGAGGTGTELSGRTINGTSSDSAKATVTASDTSPGIFTVTGLAVGTTTLSFLCEGITVTVDVTVALAVASLTATGWAGAVSAGLTGTFTGHAWSGAGGTGTELTGRTISASSSAPGVATVAPASGSSAQLFTVTGVTAGTAVITISDGNGHTATVNVTINPSGPVLDAQFSGAAGVVGAADTGQARLATAGSDWQRDGAGSLFLNDTSTNPSGMGYIIDGTGLGNGRYVEWILTHVGAANGVRPAIGLTDAANYISMRGNDMKWYTVIANTEGGTTTSWKTNPDGTGAAITDVTIAEGDVIRITNTAGVLALAVNGATKGYTTVAAMTTAMGVAGFGNGVGVAGKNFEGQVFNAGTPFVRYGYLKVVGA